MRTNHIAVAIVAALSSPILAAACGDSTTAEVEPITEVTKVEAKDEVNAVPQGLALEVCTSASKTLEARRAFCNSALVEPNQKQACWSRLRTRSVDHLVPVGGQGRLRARDGASA